MYENRINDFKNILAKVSGEDLFDDNGDGSLITTVHTGETIEAFRLNVDFFRKLVIITTSAFLAVSDYNLEQVSVLITSINNVKKDLGTFSINDKNLIVYEIGIEFEDFADLNNPFDIIFYGCERFAEYTKMILKASAGETVFFQNFIK